VSIQERVFSPLDDSISQITEGGSPLSKKKFFGDMSHLLPHGGAELSVKLSLVAKNGNRQ
jgi:hypothetical protein